MVSKTLFSSDSDIWSTPLNLFLKLDNIFNFDLDTCANEENAKCKRYITPEQNSLTKKWNCNSGWCNMPYSEIKLWMEKAYRQVEKGNAKIIVCLTPARTDTIWWHNWSVKASTIVFIKGRLKFNNSKTAAPFPSCLIIFGHVSNEQKRQLSQFGQVVEAVKFV